MISKPENMHIKDYLIKKIAINKVTDKIISEKIMHKVISHQFEGLRKSVHTCSSVELSGFGKFLFNVKKAQRHMDFLLGVQEKLNRRLIEEKLTKAMRELLTKRYNYVSEDITKLKTKL